METATLSKPKTNMIGKRIKLISMGEDPNPITEGSEGTVLYIDSLGTIVVKWDSGRMLGVIPEEDKFEIF